MSLKKNRGITYCVYISEFVYNTMNYCADNKSWATCLWKWNDTTWNNLNDWIKTQIIYLLYVTFAPSARRRIPWRHLSCCCSTTFCCMRASGCTWATPPWAPLLPCASTNCTRYSVVTLTFQFIYSDPMKCGETEVHSIYKTNAYNLFRTASVLAVPAAHDHGCPRTFTLHRSAQLFIRNL